MNIPDKLSSLLREAGLFAAIGVVATVTHYVVALGAERFFAARPFCANLAGYLAAVSLSYFGNARLTFQTSAFNAPQFARFAAISLSGLAINQLVVLSLTAWADWPLWAALIPALTLVPAYAFIGSKLLVFERKVPR